MQIDWGITVHFGILDDKDEPKDLLDALLDNLELTADSDDPQLRASLVMGEERLTLGTVEELLAQLRAENQAHVT